MEYWNQRSELDRLEEFRKDASWIAEQWEAGARVLPMDGSGQVACTPEGEALRSEVSAGAYDSQRCHLLGRWHDELWFTTTVPSEELGTARTVRGLSHLRPGERDLAMTAVALGHWHRLEPFCPRCSGPTRIESGGFTRRCLRCDRVLFPRSDPAVIVAVVDEQDRLLLGHQGVWDTGRMSTFAGFVEAGESLEQAVHREMGEETGLVMREVHYLGSQPWPFPRSLMLGFWARAQGAEHRVDGAEIEYAEWFTPVQLAEATESGRVTVPGPGTIARRLVDAWLAGEFGGPGSSGGSDSGVRLHSSW